MKDMYVFRCWSGQGFDVTIDDSHDQNTFDKLEIVYQRKFKMLQQIFSGGARYLLKKDGKVLIKTEYLDQVFYGFHEDDVFDGCWLFTSDLQRIETYFKHFGDPEDVKKIFDIK